MTPGNRDHGAIETVSAKKPSLQTIRVLMLPLLVGSLLSAAVGYLIWLYVIIDTEERRLDQLSRKNAQHQQQVIQNYLVTLKAKIATYSRDQVLAAQLLAADTQGLNKYRERLMKTIDGLGSVRFFGLNQAQIEEMETAVNFIVIDMINRSESGAVVHPEIIGDKGQNTPLIAVVAPIYRTLVEEEIIGTIYLSVSAAALQQLLSSLDQTLGQTQVSQLLADKQPNTFFSVGDGGEYRAQQLPIADSHWQLQYTPSMASYRQVTLSRVSILVSMLCLALSLTFLCCYLARFINRRRSQLAATATSSKFSTKLAVNSPTTKPPATVTIADFTTSDIGKTAAAGRKEAVTGDSANDLTNDLLDFELAEEDQLLLDGPIDIRATRVADKKQRQAIPDNIFRAYDIRGIAGKQLTCELAMMIGQSFASKVLDKGDKSIFVGRDGRTHSPQIAHAFMQGALRTGCHIIELGLVPTPLMNFATLNCDETSSGVMITASHNPKEYNGFKFVIKGRTLVDRDMQAIKHNIANGDFHTGQGSTSSRSVSSDYVKRILDDIALASNLHIVIDAANGTTSTIAPLLFEELGCTVTPLFCEVDGNFPNHDPDPSVVENLQPLIHRVKAVDADLGLAFDGDGDRLVVVTPTGNIIWPDQLMMLFAKDIVSRNPGCQIIYDVKSTRQLHQIITASGGKPIMWKTGHANMKTKMRDTGALLAGEFSGHIFFKERWFGFDDGMYAAARLLELISLGGRDIDHLFAKFSSLVSTPEIKIPVEENEKFAIMESLIATTDFVGGKVSTIDGIRVDFTKGWGLIRASNTSAALTLRFEAETKEEMTIIKKLFKDEFDKVDSTLSTHFYHS